MAGSKGSYGVQTPKGAWLTTLIHGKRTARMSQERAAKLLDQSSRDMPGLTLKIVPSGIR